MVDESAVRAAVRRGVRRSIAGLIIGLLIFAAGITVAALNTAANDELRARGGSTTGRVVDVYDGTKHSSVDVTYTAAGKQRTETVNDTVNDYEIGQRVTVHYDRHDPSVMTINDEDNSPWWVAVGFSVPLVAGLVWACYAASYWRDWAAGHRTLRSAPWRHSGAELTADDQSRIIASWPDAPVSAGMVWRSRSVKPLMSRWAEPTTRGWRGGDTDIAGPVNGTAVLAQDNGARLLVLRHRNLRLKRH